MVQEEKCIVSNLNFEVTPGELLVIVGQVGCGKTTTLMSILEETSKVFGNLKVAGTIAYVEQEPFILSSSIKDNITFGKRYDAKLLDKALEVACLDQDIKEFSKGVDTVIGERGINISGG